MPVDTSKRREAALLDGAVIFPDASIDSDDRMTLLGLYPFLVATTAGLSLNMYIELARTAVTPNTSGMTLELSRAVNMYVDRSRDVSLDLT